MNLKKFLKPNWRKIVIFAIIFFISILTSKMDYISGELVAFFIIFNPILLLPLFLLLGGCSNVQLGDRLSLFGGVKFCPGGINFLIGIILSIFYWYLLSCLLLWIYDKKFRKVKKKK